MLRLLTRWGLALLMVLAGGGLAYSADGPRSAGGSATTAAAGAAGGEERGVAAAARHNGMLHQQGMRMVDEQGREVKLRGVNLGGWLVWEGWIFGNGVLTSQATMTARLERVVGGPQTAAFRTGMYDHFVAEADIRKMAQAGFNAVRVPLHYRQFDDPAGWKLVDAVLGWCAQYKLYAVLDLHVVPGCSIGMQEPASVWKSAATRQKIVGIWQALATRYGHNKTVAGYDLLNEPLPPTGPALVDFYRQMSAAIRAVDRDHLLILEGSKFASDFSMFDKPLDDNQAYSFHMYTWFGDGRAKKLAEYQALALRHNAPLWNGEFGQNTYEVVDSTLDMFARYPQINGWAYWTWKKAPGPYGGGGFPGVVTIKVSPDWRTTMDWLGALFERTPPAPATVQAGMKDFLEAVQMKNCNYDERMVQILLKKRP